MSGKSGHHWWAQRVSIPFEVLYKGCIASTPNQAIDLEPGAMC
jgi:hypothetical protein